MDTIGANGMNNMKERLQCTDEEKNEAFETVRKIFQYARIAQRESIFGLEEPLKKEKDKFLKDGLTLAMDGIEPAELMDYMISYITIADMYGRRFLEMMMISDAVLKIQENVNPKHIVMRFIDWFGEDFRGHFEQLMIEMNEEEQRAAKKKAESAFSRSPVSIRKKPR